MKTFLASKKRWIAAGAAAALLAGGAYAYGECDTTPWCRSGSVGNGRADWPPDQVARIRHFALLRPESRGPVDSHLPGAHTPLGRGFNRRATLAIWGSTAAPWPLGCLLL